jgi:hypothetical protein
LEKSEYQKYLASREWSVLKERIRERSGGICERFKWGKHDVTHHLTYERVGHEKLSDLLGLCEDCHKFLSGKSDHDPEAYRGAVIGEGLARIRKAKMMIDSAYDLMSDCYPDDDYANYYFHLSEYFGRLMNDLQKDLAKR